MAYNKVVYGGKTLIDLSSATATADKILSGYTAYGKSGAKISGTATTLTKKTATATLTTAGWSNKTQTVTVSGVTADSGKCTIIVEAASTSEAEYAACGVLCTAQGANKLTFTCEFVPAKSLVANITFFV